MWEAWTTGCVRGRLGADVVAVEGDVEVADRQLGVGQLAEQGVQATGQHRAASVDPDDRQAARSRGSSRRSRGRSAAASAAGRRARARPSRSLFASFLASRDLVKGRPQSSSEGGEVRVRPLALANSDAGRLRSERPTPRTRSFGSPGSVRDELGVAALGEGDLDRRRSRGGRRSARRPPGPPRGPCRRGSGRRCGRGRASSRAASRATAAAWPTVEWPVSAARWTSSSAKLASWISSSASAAAATVAGHGRGVAGDDHRAAGRGSAPPPPRARPGPPRPATSSPALQGGEGRAFGHPEPLRRLGVEAARAAPPRPGRSRWRARCGPTSKAWTS